jgi:hypothetical protein
MTANPHNFFLEGIEDSEALRGWQGRVRHDQQRTERGFGR